MRKVLDRAARLGEALSASGIGRFASGSSLPAIDSTQTSAIEFPHGVSVTAIAEIASLVGDPARLNMLLALLDGFPLTARNLAEIAGVTPQTASSHLRKLRTAGLLRVQQQGRNRLHSLATPSAVRMLVSMGQVVVDSASRHPAVGAGWPDAGIGLARICNGHMAGRLAVALFRSVRNLENADLTEEGRARLLTWGVDAETLAPLSGCFDWSERSDHLAGALGCRILTRALELNWIKRIPGKRTLLVTGIGMRGFQSHFNIDVPDRT